VSGKHGRRRLGRPDEPAGVSTATTRPTHGEVDDEPLVSVPETKSDAASATAALPPPPTYRAPAPPTPPSLPPIRTAPLPEYAQLVSPPEQAAVAVAEPTVEAPAPVAVVEAPPPPVVEAPPAAVVEAPPPPVVEAPPPAAVVEAPPPPPVVEAPAPPVVEAPPAPAPVVDVPEPLAVESTSDSEDDEPAAELPLIAPASHEPILPRKRLGSRGSVRAEKAGRRRKRTLTIIAGIVAVGLLAWWVVAATGKSGPKKAAAPPVGRTQSTLLIQLSGALGSAVDSALVAHDPAHKNGAVVLVPSGLVAQVPGFGSMPFGQALSVGDPNAPRTALSDLIGVTVDGAWTLSPQALTTLINNIGGVTVDVDKDITKTGADGTTTIVVSAGNQKLDGKGAVAFGTFLAPGETEQARLARFDLVFRQVLAALPKGDAAVTTLLSGLGAGSTSTVPVAKLSAVLTGLASDAVANSMDDEVLPVTSLDTGQDIHAFTLDGAKTAALVSSQFAGSVPANRKATGNRVYVQNQIGTPGIGETTRAKLEQAGFVYIHGDNTEDMPNATAPSVVVIFGKTAAQIAEGQKVALALGLPVSDVRVSDQGFPADIVVKIGADYKQ
jgi:anionic cell wall polymer biosynthesis LytR-Cps2A-Psr (LCP) family protein